MSKCPFVAVRTDIRKEERVLVIADIAGYNRHEAIGRLVDMWAWCTDRYLADAPDDCEGYAVSEQVVCRFLGPLGVRAILGDSCDELALGELRPDGLVYLRGTSETVSRLRALRRSASAGGEARTKGVAPRRRRGRFVGEPTKSPADHQPRTSRAPAVVQPVTSDSPAGTSVKPQATSQIHKPAEEEELSLSPPAPRRTGDHAAVVAAFTARYEQAYGTKPTWGSTQGAMVKRLLTKHPAAEIGRRIAILFDSPPPFLAESPRDLATLVQHFDKCVAPTRNGARASPAAALIDALKSQIAAGEPEEHDQH